LGELINNARLAGHISWYAIEDRTRNLRGLSHWTSPGAIVQSCADGYNVDKWTDQNYHIECWVEKDALIGVVGTACQPLDVNYFSCRGYVSQSEMWGAAQRLIRTGKRCIILHLGDHDPSGVDMSRDIADRITMFWEHDSGKANFELKRIALNWDQIEQYAPPPNPAKLTDSRSTDYINNYGDQSWELDALEPTVIADLIKTHVMEFRDEARFQAREKEQESARELLGKVSAHWDDVAQFVGQELEY
jgi:hypothetical protein